MKAAAAKGMHRCWGVTLSGTQRQRALCPALICRAGPERVPSTTGQPEHGFLWGFGADMWLEETAVSTGGLCGGRSVSRDILNHVSPGDLQT